MNNLTTKQLIDKNPVNRGLDYTFVDALMLEQVRTHYGGLTDLRIISRVRYKRRVSVHSTFIYSYTIRGTAADASPRTLHLVYSAKSDHSRFHTYRVLRMFIDNGFNLDGYKVITPVAFIAEIEALIYEAVPGRTMYEHLKEATDPASLKPIAIQAANWIKKFHTFSLAQKLIDTIPVADLFGLNLMLDEVVTLTKEADAHQGQKLVTFLGAFRELENELIKDLPLGMVYGDLHPENILSETLTPDGLTLIDFTDVSRGDQLRDLGSFIQQLSFMGRQRFPMDAIEPVQRAFVETYFGCPLASIPRQSLQRINLYQSWNALRGFIYFFLNDDERPRSYGLLEDAWRYLQLARDANPSITTWLG